LPKELKITISLEYVLGIAGWANYRVARNVIGYQRGQIHGVLDTTHY